MIYKINNIYMNIPNNLLNKIICNILAHPTLKENNLV